MTQYFEKLEGKTNFILDTYNLDKTQISEIEFQKGVNDSSYTAGYISTLIAMGVEPNTALDYLLQVYGIDSSAQTTVKVSELTANAAEKMEKEKELEKIKMEL